MDDYTEDELEELKDSVREGLGHLNEKLMRVMHIEEVLEQVDEHGSVSVEVKESATGRGIAIVSIQAWLQSLRVKGRMSDENLAEALVQLDPNRARVSYDREANVYSIQVDAEL